MLRISTAAAVLLLASAGLAGAQTFSGGGFAIPDNDAAGASSTINVPVSYSLVTVSFTVTFSPTHTFVGDLIAKVTHGATTVDLFRQVGWVTATPGPGDGSDMGGTYGFIDSATNRIIDVARTVNDVTVVTPGNYQATTNIFNGNGDPTFTGETVVNLNAAFFGANVNGNWTLNVADIAFGDTGSVSGWSVTVSGIPEPGLCAAGGVAAAGAAYWLRLRQRRGGVLLRGGKRLGA